MNTTLNSLESQIRTEANIREKMSSVEHHTSKFFNRTEFFNLTDLFESEDPKWSLLTDLLELAYFNRRFKAALKTAKKLGITDVLTPEGKVWYPVSLLDCDSFLHLARLEATIEMVTGHAATSEAVKEVCA